MADEPSLQTSTERRDVDLYQYLTEPLEDGFQFVTIGNPQELADPKLKHSIRSHAVRHGIENRKKRQRIEGQPFRFLHSASDNPPPLQDSEIWRQAQSQIRSPNSIFNLPWAFAGNDANALSRLQALLSSNEARLALEPVFSIDQDVALQTFSSVFRPSLHDPALLNAVLLAATFAVAGGVFNQESLHYQTETMKAIRKRISSSVPILTTSTLGAILLLAGVEMRLGMRSQVELHLRAVWRLLELCKTRQDYLTDDIKRAIFWQDLYAHIFTASERIVDHTTFSELWWQRDVFSPESFIVPPGFQKRSSLFPQEFLEVLKDVNALTALRDSPIYTHADTSSMIHMDNQQAWVQSRLVDLRKLPFIQECCRLAAYLCASTNCCQVWRLSVMPPQISSQLFCILQEKFDDSVWNGEQDLLAWLLCIGGAFAPEGPIRVGYASRLRSDAISGLQDVVVSWDDLIEVLRQFLWSEKVFTPHVKTFWKEAMEIADCELES